MEHEENVPFENFLQNTQHNLQHGNNNAVGAGEGLGLDAGIGCGVGVGPGDLGGVGENINAGSGKYEELDENRHFADDDNEWKYISEVNQSEKKTASNGNNNLHVEYNNDHHDNEIDDNDDDDDEDADMPSMQYRKNNDATPNGNGEHLNGVHLDGAANNNHHELDEYDINKADIGDFSTTSNTISTAEGGDIAGVQVDLIHAEINFENQDQQHQQQPQQQQQQVDFEEEDPSSNCTSSLSENLPPQQQQQQPSLSSQVEESNNFDIDGSICDDKENADPYAIGVQQHPTDLHLNDAHAFLLNPDAKEFVPSFNSNPTSPTTSEADHPVGEPVEPAQEQQNMQQQQQPHLSALSRHLLLADDDDFVAHSPRKGREMDIDGLALPPSENEFEHEAAMRPHELEQEEDLIGDSSLVATGANDLPLDVAAKTKNNTEEEQIKQFNDGADFVLHGGENHENLQSPASFIDHDVENHMEAQNRIHEFNNVNDVMKQSMYEENRDIVSNGNIEQEPEQIENILNSVQPLPTDMESLNNSFVGDNDVATPEEIRGVKELLHDHDEKDHVSHPPSIEEMQLNLQNEFNASNKDISQIPSDLDMNSAAHMQESFYMQQHLTEEQQNQQLDHNESLFKMTTSGFDESMLLETSLHFEGNTSLLSIASTTNNPELIPDDNTQAAFDYNNPSSAATDPLLINTDFTATNKDMHYDEQQQQHGFDTNASSPSPHSTVEEKHLVEETKEQMVAKVIDDTQVFVDELEQKMENLLYSGLDDGNLKQNAELFEQNETSSIQEQEEEEEQQQEPQQAHENDHIEEFQHEIPYEQQTNEIAYEKQITVEATEIEPPTEDKPHVEEPAAPIEVESAVEATEPKSEAETLATAATVAGVVAAGAGAVALATTTAAKKTDVGVKKVATTTAKSTTAASTKTTKKPVAATDAAKKPAAKPTVGSATARPRTAPTKTTTTATSSATNIRAMSATTTTLAKKTATTAAPKATGVGSTATKTVAKTTTTSARLTATNRITSTTTSITSKTTTSTNSVTAKKSANSPTTAATAKPRTASSQPAKPAALAVKPKISPRSTLASQLRNKAGATTSTTTITSTTAATTATTKSPIKSSTLTNGVGANKSNTSLATARPKSAVAASSGKTGTTTATTKSFTARAAPKTNSTVTSTVRRTLLQQNSSTASTNGPAATKTLNKISPVKGSPSASKVETARTPQCSFFRHNGQTKDAANAAKSPTTKSKTMSSAKSPVKTGSPAAITKRIQKTVEVKSEENAEANNTHLPKDELEINKDIDHTEELKNIVGETAYHELIDVNNDVSVLPKDNLKLVDRDTEN